MLNEEEREFLRNHDGGLGGLFSKLMGEHNGSAQDFAVQAVSETIQQLCEKYPNRAVRLLMLSLVADTAKAVRDVLLREVLREELDWHAWVDDAGEEHWGAIGFQSYDLEHFTSLTGLSLTTVKRWYEQEVRDGLAAAQAAAQD